MSAYSIVLTAASLPHLSSMLDSMLDALSDEQKIIIEWRGRNFKEFSFFFGLFRWREGEYKCIKIMGKPRFCAKAVEYLRDQWQNNPAARPLPDARQVHAIGPEDSIAPLLTLGAVDTDIQVTTKNS